jgi:hypothetical protein
LFEVQDAERVTLSRIQNDSNTLVSEFPHAAICGGFDGNASDSAVGPRTYRLEAFQADGTSSITQDVVVGDRPIPTGSTFRVKNTGDHEWTIWTYSSEDESWNDTHVPPAVPTPNGVDPSYGVVSLDECSYYRIFAVDRDHMIDGEKDPDSVEASLEALSSQWRYPWGYPISELETEENPNGVFHLLGRSNGVVREVTVNASG